MKTAKKSEYDVQAEKFVSDTNITITKTYTGHRKYFDGDKERRATFHITVARGEKSFSYDFGQSIMDSYVVAEKYLNGQSSSSARFVPLSQKTMNYPEVKQSLRALNPVLHHTVRESKTAPTDYSLLACMSSDSYQSDSFEDWCGNFGYDTDSRKALETYLKCEKITSDINRLFTADELEQLQEIQLVYFPP